ncbi:hypothetical protein RB595_005219 [Gaeumannomyces hyphopodioides]
MPTNVLITGANRGIGFGLLRRYLLLPDHIVIAAVRDLAHPTVKALSELSTAEGTRLVVVQIVADVWQSPFDAVKTLQTQEGIDHLDVVIPNAAIAGSYPLVREATEEVLDAHFRTNAYSIPALFQAVRPLLQESAREPVFAVMGTIAGSHNSQPPFPNSAYGPSKSASAWFSIRLDAEEEWLNSFSFHPGWVHTEMGDKGADAFDVDQATRDKLMVSLDDSCDGMMEVLAKTSKAEHGGKLVLHSGSPVPW